MSNLDDFRTITRNIVDSYEAKVKTVSNLMRQVEGKIVAAYEDQRNAIEKIRDTLAANQNLRKRDFDRLMAPVVELQETRREQIRELMNAFCREEEENAAQLKAVLEPGTGSSLNDFARLKEKILDRPRDAEAHLGELLKSFHQDQAELDVLLRRLLNKGERVHLKDVRKAMRAFQRDHAGDGVILEDILREFSRVKEAISQQWEAVDNTVGLRGYAARYTEEAIGHPDSTEAA